MKHLLQLVGEKNLPEDQQLILFVAKMIRDGFLIQNAFNEIDAYTNDKKLIGIIKIILLIYNVGRNILKQGLSIEKILDPELLTSILRISQTIPNEAFQQIERIKRRLIQKLRILSY